MSSLFLNDEHDYPDEDASMVCTLYFLKKKLHNGPQFVNYN